MALKKEIIFENGVNIKYHYISDIKIDGKNKKAILKIDSYTDESYRVKEKVNDNNKKKYEQLLANILEENSKEVKNVDDVKIWSEEANSIVGKFIDNLDLKVATTTVELDNVTDFNESNLYKLLKNNDLFKDSEDI